MSCAASGQYRQAVLCNPQDKFFLKIARHGGNRAQCHHGSLQFLRHNQQLGNQLRIDIEVRVGVGHLDDRVPMTVGGAQR